MPQFTPSPFGSFLPPDVSLNQTRCPFHLDGEGIRSDRYYRHDWRAKGLGQSFYCTRCLAQMKLESSDVLHGQSSAPDNQPHDPV